MLKIGQKVRIKDPSESVEECAIATVVQAMFNCYILQFESTDTVVIDAVDVDDYLEVVDEQLSSASS